MNDVVIPGQRTPDASAWHTLTHVLYALHLLSWFSLGVFSVVAMAINYLKRWELPNDFYRSHFRWQSRSFWFSLFAFVLTAPLWVLFVFPGYFAWMLVGLWYLYRFVKGWWFFAEGRSMPWPTV